MKASISEIVGRGTDAVGKQIAVYRALRQLMCARCGAEINCGELFTRHKSGRIEISPRCRKCAPFTQKTSSSSSLMRELLEPSAEEKPAQPVSLDRRQQVAKEVERRLGPALSRAHHTKLKRKV